LKFLFIAEGDQQCFDASTEALCTMLRSGEFPSPDHRPVGGMYILRFDAQSKTWVYKKTG